MFVNLYHCCVFVKIIYIGLLKIDWYLFDQSLIPVECCGEIVMVVVEFPNVEFLYGHVWFRIEKYTTLVSHNEAKFWVEDGWRGADVCGQSADEKELNNEVGPHGVSKE